MSVPERPALLILGGTAEAVRLANRLVAEWGSRYEIVTSLAGRTRAPVRPRGTLRVGGFGGAVALQQYLADHKVCAIFDATHPFAARISDNARRAASIAGVPRIVLVRPHWEPFPDDDWQKFPNLVALVDALPAMARRVFLTIGRTELAAFSECRDMWFLVRMIDCPDGAVPLTNCTVITGRGPFAADDERRLLEEHKIDALVCKDSGGEATRAKLDAARALGLPVMMVERPAVPDGPVAGDLGAALSWLRDRVT
ncbi:MAG TPA: cobalt-precorrin-6A reductase [Rhodospirillaceae bacterium]|nr:cobalt-precorrin-6A reductase [Rhodospirillaceae bacterium]